MNPSSSAVTKSNQTATSQCFDFAQYPDRIFVGGFPESTTAEDLTEFFEQYVQVRECRILHLEEPYKRLFSFITLGNVEQAEFIKHLPAAKLAFKGNKLHVGPALRRIPSSTLPHYSESFGYACITPADYFPPGTFTFCPYKSPHFMRRALAEPYSPKKLRQDLSDRDSSENESTTVTMNGSRNTNTVEIGNKRDIREPNNNALVTKSRQQPPTMFPYSFMKMPAFPPPMLNQSSINVMGMQKPVSEHVPPPSLQQIPPEVYNQLRNIQLAGGDRLPSFSPFKQNTNVPEGVTKAGNYSRQLDLPRKVEEKPHKRNKNDSRSSNIHAGGDSSHPPRGKKKTYSNSSKSQERPSLEDIQAELLSKKIDLLLNSEFDDSDDVFSIK